MGRINKPRPQIMTAMQRSNLMKFLETLDRRQRWVIGGAKVVAIALGVVVIVSSLMGCSSAPRVADPFDLAIQSALVDLFREGGAPQ